MVARKKTHDFNKGGGLQLGFFTPESNWKPRSVSDLPSWADAKRICIDCETKDTELKELGPGPRRGGYTTGWAVKIEGGPKFYLPIRHEGGGNLPEQEVLQYLRDNAQSFTGDIVGANLSYDLDYAANDGIVFHEDAMFRDIQIADPLIYELHFSYSLKNLGERWGVKGKETQLLDEAARSFGLDPGAGMWRLHSKFVGEYAENDVEAPLIIYEKQRKKLDENNLWQIFDIESKVIPVLVKMCRRGVRLDFDKLAKIEEWSLSEELSALGEIKRATQIEVKPGDIMKASALVPVFQELGIRLDKTPTGAPKIDAEMLEKLEHPVGKLIRHARKVNKIRTTFAASMRKYQVNGRIHCSFHQIVASQGDDKDQKGVRYGRLSATDPNLQQQPSPDKDPVIAGEWRKIFIPEEGAIWGCSDFSSQEPRWTTHFSAVLKLPKAEEAAKRYRDDPRTDHHEMMTRLIYGDNLVNKWKAEDPKMFKVYRGYCKNIFLGLCYGKGGAQLSHTLGKPTRFAVQSGYGRDKKIEHFNNRQDAWKYKAENGGEIREVAGKEVQEILDNFDEEVPFVRGVARAAQKKAEDTGFVRTILGRRLHFSTNDQGKYDWTHKALNRVIQGSSADQTKKALVDLDRAGLFIQLQVHDEIDGSYGSVEEAEKVGKIMRESILELVQPQVPFLVDTETGPSWGEIK